MSTNNNTITINPDDLVARLAEVEDDAQGDIARVIELLLLENHVLRGQRSFGLNRGVMFTFSDFPRFLQIEEPDDDAVKEGRDKVAADATDTVE